MLEERSKTGKSNFVELCSLSCVELGELISAANAIELILSGSRVHDMTQ